MGGKCACTASMSVSLLAGNEWRLIGILRRSSCFFARLGMEINLFSLAMNN
jgi:hypothetical protein